jgi:hypothetical protein
VLPERVELVVDDGGIVCQEPVSVLALDIKEDWDSPLQLVCDDDNVGYSNRTLGFVEGDELRLITLSLDDVLVSMSVDRIKIDFLRHKINSNIAVTV